MSSQSPLPKLSPELDKIVEHFISELKKKDR